jgi:hypothetical protein
LGFVSVLVRLGEHVFDFQKAVERATSRHLLIFGLLFAFVVLLNATDKCLPGPGRPGQPKAA